METPTTAAAAVVEKFAANDESTRQNQAKMLEGHERDIIASMCTGTGDNLQKHLHVPKIKCITYDKPPEPAAVENQQPATGITNLPLETEDPPASSGRALDIDLGNAFELPGVLPEELYPDSTVNVPNNKRSAEEALLPDARLKRKISTFVTVDVLRRDETKLRVSDSETESLDTNSGSAVVQDVVRTCVGWSNGACEEFEEIDPYTGEPVLAAGAIQSAPKQDSAPWTSIVCTSVAFESLQKINANIKNRQYPLIPKDVRWLLQYLLAKGGHLLFEYGGWAADWFIGDAIRQYFEHSRSDGEQNDMDQRLANNDAKRRVRRKVLNEITVPTDLGPVKKRITPKVEKLLEVLLTEYRSEKEKFSGIVFAEQPVGVAALSEIISCHPDTKDLFRVGTMVGGNPRNGVRFLYQIAEQTDTLPDFGTAGKNLVISTSAIEMELDIKDCHLAVYFAPPKNLRNFMQRRVTAHRAPSSFVLMYGRWDHHRVREFALVEQQMVKMYSDTARTTTDVAFGAQQGGVFNQMPIEGTAAIQDAN